jgi:hypothetical protein
MEKKEKMLKDLKKKYEGDLITNNISGGKQSLIEFD